MGLLGIVPEDPKDEAAVEGSEVGGVFFAPLLVLLPKGALEAFYVGPERSRGTDDGAG